MELDWQLLERCLAGECTPDEWARYETWLASSPVHRQVVHELREVVAQSRQTVPPEHQEQMLVTLKQRLDRQRPVLRVLPI